MNIIKRIISWAESEGPTTGIALFRITVAFMLFRDTWSYYFKYIKRGHYTDHFYTAYFDWWPIPGNEIYIALIILMFISAVLMMIGYKTRYACVACFLLAAYHLSLNQFWYRHNRYLLMITLFLMCLAPCERSLSIDSLKKKLPSSGPLWFTYLYRIQISIVYLASAFSKTLDPNWSSGKVLYNRNTLKLWDPYISGWMTSSLREVIVSPVNSFCAWY